MSQHCSATSHCTLTCQEHTTAAAPEAAVWRRHHNERQLALAPGPIGQGGEEAGLYQEVGALRGLLARVAPQLEELAGVKHQMALLLSLLQPSKLSSCLLGQEHTCIADFAMHTVCNARYTDSTHLNAPMGLSLWHDWQ